MLSHALYRRGHHHQSIASWCLPRRRTLSLSSRARDAVASKRTSRVGSNAPAASTVAAAPAATEVLRNAAGVQLLSDALHRQVFGVQAFPDLDKGAVAISSEHLKRHGLAHEENPVLPTTDFTPPKLQGTNIEEHFYNIGLAHSEPYLNLAKDLARATLPWKPDTWAEVAGWVRYEPDGSFVPISSPPEDEALVFDVESLYKLNNYAVMAVAVSEKHWYGWTSPWLLGQTEEVEQLIPLPGTKPTLIVGHNVGYDRGRIQEEYSLDRTENRFLDTMSLHVAVTGLSSHQRAPWMKYRKEKRAKANAAAAIAQAAESGAGQNGRMWQDYSSMNSLADVAKLHCGIEVDKAARDWFESESRQDITNNFQELMSYCANDVGVTHEVFKVVLPAFLEACPNPVTFAGVLHMGSSFLPVDESWEAFLERAEGLYTSLTKKVEEELHALAEEARKLIYVVGKDGRMMHESDPWLKQLDWSPKNARRVVVDIGDDELALDDRIAAPSKPNIARPSKGLAKEDDGGKANAADTQAVESVEIAPPSSAGAARLFEDELEEPESAATPSAESHIVPTIPRWFTRFYAPATDSVTREGWDRIAPVLLGVRFNGQALRYDKTEGWYFRKSDQSPTSKPFTRASQTVFNKNWLAAFTDGRATSNNNKLAREACNLGVSTRGTARSSQVVHLEKQFLTLAQTVIALSEKERSADDGLSQLDWTAIVRPPKYILPWQNQAADIASKEEAPQHVQQKHSTQSVSTSTESIRSSDRPALFEEADSAEAQPAVGIEVAAASEKDAPTSVALTPAQRARAIWPKWFWDLQGPSGSLTIRSKLAPLLLQLRWKDHPIFSSRQHGWVFRVPAGEVAAEAAERAREAAAKADAGTGDSDLAEEEERYTKRGRGRSKKDKEEPLGPQPVEFSLESDSALALDTEHKYFKLPHKDGEKANVGSPLSKTFIPAFESGTLSSQFEAAAAALDMNAQCSYWTSARDRILKQFVVWATEKNARGFPTDSPRSKHGLILPQVITMGTVTRRAVESTWLAASNAKKNRLGSELKAMIRAPPGYAIVGADVDSEELWICCVMGDAQFGVHGATAIGWMTLEGTKSAGTDLHSKTASILGISRDMAKVFNYSRIYGAGVAHAVQLLMQSNPNLTKQEATEAAKQLYAATKGHKVHSDTNVFRSKFWHGGTESHVFNTLEKIAMAAEPRTPALGCGITAALAKGNLPATEKSKQGEDYMPSRINWVVQSSGVDYLHMLMVSMEYLTKRFDINARFMISVHDEIRYLVKEEDRYRAALALQVSNLWTRALFAHRLQMESLPQSCAWFSAVDLDHVLRKEVNMDCVTPSQPTPIPHGVSQDILATLEHTSAGSLFKNGQPMREEATLPVLPNAAQAAQQPATIPYRATDRFFLLAQDAGTPEALATVIAQKTQQSAGLDYAGGWDLAKDHLEEAARQRQASSASRRPVKSPATPSKKASSVSRSRAAKGTIPQASTKKVPLAANSQPGNRHAADPSSIPGRPKASRYPTDGTKARPASRGLQPPPTRSPSSGFLKRRAPDS